MRGAGRLSQRSEEMGEEMGGDGRGDGRRWERRGDEMGEEITPPTHRIIVDSRPETAAEPLKHESERSHGSTDM